MVPFLAKIGQVPRRLYSSYRANSPSSLTTLGCLKGCSSKYRAQIKRQPPTDLLYSTHHASKRVHFARVKSIEIQSQRVAPGNLLVGSSVQKEFEKGLRVVYFEVLLVRYEQVVDQQEGIEEYLSPRKSNTV